MNIKATTALLALMRGATLTLDDSRGALVRVLTGELWITQDGDPNDHFAATGAPFRISRGGATVLQALDEARFVVEAPQAAALETWREPLARPHKAA
jgi:hypothetical protein